MWSTPKTLLEWSFQVTDLDADCGGPFFFKQAADAAGHKLPLPELDGRQWAEMPGQRITTEAP